MLNQRKPADGVCGTRAAKRFFHNENGTKPKATPSRAQVLDDAGHRLPVRWSAIVGQPRLAVPSWHRLVSAERWREARA